MQLIEEYKLLCCTSGLDAPLTTTVNEMLKGGWVPLGAPSVILDDAGDVTLYQAMIKVSGATDAYVRVL